MTQTSPSPKATIDWLTVIAIAAIAVSLTIAFHEGIHTLSCLVVGGDVLEYSALHAQCSQTGSWQGKFISGSASISNLILGSVCLILLRKSRQQSAERQFFLWLFMLMNWLNGAGYWMLSGIGNFGDWANVIDGWEPHWLWRLGMALVGTAVFMFVVGLALKELGKIIGGEPDEQIGRASKLGILSYVTATLVILAAGIFNPYGFGSSPVVGGLMGVLGGFSPLIWMMQWFRAKSFVKLPQPALAIQRQWSWVLAAGIVVFVYAFVLGRTLYF